MDSLFLPPEQAHFPEMKRRKFTVKKSLVVLMAVAMTFAFAAATVAADLSWYFGGDMYFYADSQEHGLIESQGTIQCGDGLTVKLTNGNTWAKMWLNEDKWRTPNNQWRFAFGWDKIGDVLDLGFASKDTGLTNIGQVPITDLFNNFHGDPVFNTCNLPYAANAVLTVGNFVAKAEVNVAPDTGNFGGNTADYSVLRDFYSLAFIFKLDSGDIHFGYQNAPNVGVAQDGYLALLGGAFAIGEANLKIDAWKDHGSWMHEWGSASQIGNYSNDSDDIGKPAGAGNGAQVNLGINKVNATIFYFAPDTDGLNNEIGLAFNYKLTDKLSLGAKYFKDYTGSDTLDDNAWEAFGIYNVGAFDVKFGALNRGEESQGNDDDTSVILGFHASLW
ncbi:MAG TPA: hypothetical protein VHR47_04100 [Bacillota bacterium]|nr:hypothetical protein [Bacillota bacterium]